MRSAIVERPIDPATVLLEVQRATNGAAVLFVGTVRELNEGREVSGLEYSAYVPMAEAELAGIVAETAAEFGTDDIVAEHRIGALAIGDIAVAVAAGHPHRGAAFDAAREVIEALKKRVPIWKREQYVAGEREWVVPAEQR